MEYLVDLKIIDRFMDYENDQHGAALLAIAERLERIAELMEQQQEAGDYQTVKLIQAIGNAALHMGTLITTTDPTSHKGAG